jgi:thiol-disulfide isomerase/thioredoxin
MFLLNKENNFKWNFSYLIIIISLSGCITQKSYKEINFKKETILVGRISETNLMEHKKTKWYIENYNKYVPDSLIMIKLKQNLPGINFIIFGGTWCSDTKRELPAFLSILHQLSVGSNRYDMWMLDLKKESTYINPKLYDIQYVPTILIYKDGKEIGRIIEKPKETLEVDLLKIISNP